MEHWKSPAYQEAEREYAELNQNLLQEVSLTVPAITEPPNVASSPKVNTPPVIGALEVPESPSVSVPMTTKDLGSMGFQAEWVQGTALQKPHSGAPLPLSTKEFNLGEQGQDHQAKIPQFFNLIGSNVERTAHMSGNPNAQSVSVTENPPEEIQKSVSELLQQLENEQKAQEKLAEENRRRFQTMMNSPKVFIGGLSDAHNDGSTGIMDLRTTSSTPIKGPYTLLRRLPFQLRRKRESELKFVQ